MKYIILLIIAIAVLIGTSLFFIECEKPKKLESNKKIELPQKPDTQIIKKDNKVSVPGSKSKNFKTQKTELKPEKAESQLKSQPQPQKQKLSQGIKKNIEKNVENKIPSKPAPVADKSKQLTENMKKYIFQQYDREANAQAFIHYLNQQEISFDVLCENKAGYSNILFMFEDEQDKEQKLAELEKITGMQFN